MKNRNIWKIGKCFVDIDEVVAINEFKPFGIIEIYLKNGNVFKVDDVSYDDINKMYQIYYNCNEEGVIHE